MSNKSQPTNNAPTPRSQFILFADSEVISIKFVNSSLCILFSAAHVLRDAPASAESSTEGFARNVEFALAAAKTDQSTDELFGRITSGRVFIRTQWMQQIPLPYSIILPIKLELTFANQSYLEAEATSLKCRFTGEPNFFESMAC